MRFAQKKHGHFLRLLAFAQPTADPTAPAEPATPAAEPTEPLGPTAPTAPVAPPTNSTPARPPSYVAAFAPVPIVTSVIYGVCYAGLNILLIVGLVVLIACFKRRIRKKPSKANPGAS